MHDYFRGNPDKRNPLEFLTDREPIPAEYRNRDARIERMDEQGVEAIWLFPTLGVLYEELLKQDGFAVTTTFRAFNQWLLEDWGFHYQDRIFAAPYISLADPEWAVRELEWALGEGARVVCMRPSAVLTAQGWRTPSDPMFDPFWARCAEAGIAVVVHAGDSGVSSNGYAEDGFGANFSGGGWKPSIKSFNIERAAFDFLITLSFEKLYDRHPGLRIASVENGSTFLADLFAKLRSTDKKMPGWFTVDPVEQFKQHVWINPFWEDDPYETAELMGTDRVIFGSDWPHIEGMPRPLDYAAELKEFSAADQLLIMRDNTRALNAPPA
jgi:predicted TIM-barrel fold metal-dependent hydrolase